LTLIAKHISLTSICKSLSLLNKILLLLALIVSLIFVMNFFVTSEREMFTLGQKKSRHISSPQFDYCNIGQGALALKAEIQNFPFPNLSGEVLFLGKNTRPDASLYNVNLHMGLKGCDKTLMVAPEQKLYLSYIKQHLYFAKETTPLWIKPYLNEKGETWLEMGLKLISESGEVLLDEVRAFEIESSLKRDFAMAVKDPLLAKGLKEMKEAKWWSPDRLFEAYGGEEFRKLIGMERLEFQQHEQPYFLYVKEGDTFIWKEEKWQVSRTTHSYPMARLTHISPYKMEWELWDKTGLECVRVAHSKEKVEGINLRVEELFTRMRQRTTSRISCRIDNKAAILKKGDWLIHIPTGWHILKSLKEMEAILNFEVKGELFVFDGLEKIEGKPVFCGTLFDKMRTQMQSVRLPLAQGKASEHSPPTKKTISTKIRPATPDEQPTKKQRLKRPRQKSRKKVQPIDDYGISGEE
jgi:hypothetical protein